MSTPKVKTYTWLNRDYTVREIVEEMRHLGLGYITPEAMRHRLKMTGGSVIDAVNYVPKSKAHIAEVISCPDGVNRTTNEIAKHFSLTRFGWVSRCRRLGFEKAWEVGTKTSVTGRSSKNYYVPVVKTKSAEELRQEEALAAMSKFNATKYEKEL